jgi:hypothetical protein
VIRSSLVKCFKHSLVYLAVSISYGELTEVRANTKDEAYGLLVEISSIMFKRKLFLTLISSISIIFL